MIPSAQTFPVKPGDWVSDGTGRIAKVRSVDRDEHGIMVDLYLYARNGEKIGRSSPVMGGPKTFEPACSWDGWYRIEEPSFPLRLEWQQKPNGTRCAEWSVGEKLPERQWVKPRRKAKAPVASPDEFRRALQSIANGHNDARGLASAVLGRKQ